MIEAIHIAGSALHANQQWLDNISTNVANINTPGYKTRDISFLSAIAPEGSAALPAGTAGLVRAETGAIDTATGDIRQTGRELDIAINGRGWFRVHDADGNLAYTRTGRFVVTEQGALATVDGRTLADDVMIPPDALAVSVNNRGEVQVKLPDQAAPMLAGTIRTVDIPDLSALTEVSPGTWLDPMRAATSTDGTPGDGVLGQLQQGHLEYSNVDLVNEMSQLVIAQRAYQLNARVLQIGDQVLETINNLRR